MCGLLCTYLAGASYLLRVRFTTTVISISREKVWSVGSYSFQTKHVLLVLEPCFNIWYFKAFIYCIFLRWELRLGGEEIAMQNMFSLHILMIIMILCQIKFGFNWEYELCSFKISEIISDHWFDFGCCWSLLPLYFWGISVCSSSESVLSFVFVK